MASFKADTLTDYLRHRRPGHVAVAQALLTNPQMSVRDISTHCNLYFQTVQKIILELKGKHLIHICDWENPLGPRAWRPIYKAGPGRNVPRPTSERRRKQDPAEQEVEQGDKAYFLAMMHALVGKVRAPDQAQVCIG